MADKQQHKQQGVAAHPLPSALSEAQVDELLALALAVANGWPRESAPASVQASYREALRTVARAIVCKHPRRVAIIRARNAAERAEERAEGQATLW